MSRDDSRQIPPLPSSPGCPSTCWAGMLVPSCSSLLCLGRSEQVSCATWIFMPLHPSLGQENHRPPPWRRPRRCPINTSLFPVHLLRSRKRHSLIISARAASSVLLAGQAEAFRDLFCLVFFFPPPEFCCWWGQPVQAPLWGWRNGGGSGAGSQSHAQRERGSGEPGHSIDDVGQGSPGLRGREAVQGLQRAVSVAAAEVDGSSHTFASLDGFPQLSENTGTVGWVSAVSSNSTWLPPPLPGVKASSKAG